MKQLSLKVYLSLKKIVWDQDFISSDDFMGKVEMKLDKLELEKELTLKLSTKGTITIYASKFGDEDKRPMTTGKNKKF